MSPPASMIRLPLRGWPTLRTENGRITTGTRDQEAGPIGAGFFLGSTLAGHALTLPQEVQNRVILAKARNQNFLNLLDSGLLRNDDSWRFSIFYDHIKLRGS
jgi:hypothetical protein